MSLPSNVCSLTSCSNPSKDRCSRCKRAYYCSREHQKEHWPIHKIACPKQPGTTREPSETDLFPVTPVDPTRFSNAIEDPWAGKSKEDAYIHLIDAYRMRVEDEYSFTGDVDTGSLYGGTQNPIAHFRRFIQLAQRVHAKPGNKKTKVLPSWWDPAVDEAAVQKLAQKHEWANIRYAVEKSDIQEHYGSPIMPMLLRLTAEKISGPIGY